MKTLILTLIALFCTIGIWGCKSSESKGTIAEGTVAADESFELSLEHASIRFPAGAFADPMRISVFSGSEAVSLDDLETQYDLVSEPVAFEFEDVRSTEVGSEGTITMRLLPEVDETRPFLAMLKYSSSILPSDFALNSWFPLVGLVDEEARTLSFLIFSTPQKLSVVLIAVGPPSPSEQTSVPDESTGLISRASAIREPPVADAGWIDQPWLVMCDKERLGTAVSMCTQEKLTPALERFEAAAKHLNSYSLVRSRHTMYSLREAQRHFPAVDETLFVTTDEDRDRRRNFVLFSDTQTCEQRDDAGCRDPVSGMLVITPKGMAFPAAVMAHELMHGVQHAYAPAGAHNIDNSKWVWEGTAQAVANDLDSSIRFGQRDWEKSLFDNSEKALAYQTMSFFTDVSAGDFSYLSDFFSNYIGSDTFTAANRAFVASTNISLEDNFLEFALFGISHDTCPSIVAPQNGVQRQVMAVPPFAFKCLSINSPSGGSTDCGVRIEPKHNVDDPSIPQAVFVVNDDVVAAGGTAIGDPDAKILAIGIDETGRNLNVDATVPFDFATNQCAAAAVDITGTWMAADGFDYIRIRQAGDSISGDALLGVCEELAPISSGTFQADRLTLSFEPEAFLNVVACLGATAGLDLRLTGDNQLNGIIFVDLLDDSSYGYYEAPINLTKVSNDPNYELNRLLTDTVEL